MVPTKMLSVMGFVLSALGFLYRLGVEGILMLCILNELGMAGLWIQSMTVLLIVQTVLRFDLHTTLKLGLARGFRCTTSLAWDWTINPVQRHPTRLRTGTIGERARKHQLRRQAIRIIAEYIVREDPPWAWQFRYPRKPRVPEAIKDLRQQRARANSSPGRLVLDAEFWASLIGSPVTPHVPDSLSPIVEVDAHDDQNKEHTEIIRSQHQDAGSSEVEVSETQVTVEPTTNEPAQSQDAGISGGEVAEERIATETTTHGGSPGQVKGVTINDEQEAVEEQIAAEPATEVSAQPEGVDVGRNEDDAVENQIAAESTINEPAQIQDVGINSEEVVEDQIATESSINEPVRSQDIETVEENQADQISAPEVAIDTITKASTPPASVHESSQPVAASPVEQSVPVKEDGAAADSLSLTEPEEVPSVRLDSAAVMVARAAYADKLLKTTRIRTLGEGGMGIVAKYRDPVTGVEYVAKTANTDIEIDEQTGRLESEERFALRVMSSVRALRKECGITRSFEHENILKVTREWEEEGIASKMVMEEMGGDMHSLIKDLLGDVEKKEAAVLAALHATLKAVEYIGSRGFLHTDLKNANLLYKKVGVDPATGYELYEFKVADFGLARRIADGGAVWETTKNICPLEVTERKQMHPSWDVVSAFLMVAQGLNLGGCLSRNSETLVASWHRDFLSGAFSNDVRLQDFLDWFKEAPEERMSAMAARERIEIFRELPMPTNFPEGVVPTKFPADQRLRNKRNILWAKEVVNKARANPQSFFAESSTDKWNYRNLKDRHALLMKQLFRTNDPRTTELESLRDQVAAQERASAARQTQRKIERAIAMEYQRQPIMVGSGSLGRGLVPPSGFDMGVQPRLPQPRLKRKKGRNFRW